jgi:glucose-1-phosphate cytidylyltransferase
VTLSLGRYPAIQYNDNHDEEDWTVTLADTGEESMTAYRVRQIQKYLAVDEPFLLTYGDGVCDLDINASIECHYAAGKILTLTAVHPAGRFGSLGIGSDGTIESFLEKPQMEAAYVNGGYMICNPAIFDYLPEDSSVMLERGPITSLAEDRQLNCYKHEGFWQPMDTYQEALYLNKIWAEGKAPWKIW